MYVYLPWWLTAPVAFGAPANDLELINKLLRYREVDYAMAKKVMGKLKNHLWYLVDKMVPLSLFSPIVSEDMEDRIVKKMLTYPTVDATLNCTGTGYGKPVNPPPMPDSIDEGLSRFVGPGSMKVFDITHLNSSFLHEPVANWELNVHSHEARRTVVNLAVTNDAAERELSCVQISKTMSGMKLIFKLFYRQW